MTTRIEASSFSTITDIANNPPLALQGFNTDRLGTLTLYITRVPGSRDVFLTTLKPRDRVVTAQDVQSSLYYVHMHGDEDFEILAHEDTLKEHRFVREEQSVERQILLQEEVRPTLPDRVRRDISRDNEWNVTSASNSHTASAISSTASKQIKRKPVLREVTNIETTSRLSLLPNLPPRPLPPLPHHAVLRNHKHDVEQNPDENLRLPLSPSQLSSYEDAAGRLMLIRREPSSGQQWNVATMQELHDNEGLQSRASTRDKKRSGASVQLGIHNSAYQHFDAGSDVSKYGDSSCFMDVVLQLRSPLRAIEARLSSEDSISTRPRSIDLRRNGYQFRSPWDGICEFTTSVTGNALVCKHTINHFETVEVSELRFNLPPRNKGAATTAEHDERTRSYLNTMNRRSKLVAVRNLFSEPKAEALLEPEQYEFMQDMTLGQEKAGGGFAGRNPKLGKLIIHPSGLAMLDLLVAANVALWWRAWNEVH